jgi:SpoIID/LytB domain protein
MRNDNRIPVIEAGILTATRLSFTLNSPFVENTGLNEMEGTWHAFISGDMIVLKKDAREITFQSGTIISPAKMTGSSFTLHDVTIGLNFHWQRSEDQIFRGDLKLIVENGKITAINIISLEEYLTSVISSEMSAASSEELLKAHAVISRGWLLAQAEKRCSSEKGASRFNSMTRTENEITRWYDREDHLNFDVCADDHCQRYQGITRASKDLVGKVVEETAGEVLEYDGTICDTRYYKCCGGVTELFENAWEPVNQPYLKKVVDRPAGSDLNDTDLTNDGNAEKWIMGTPDAFCNTSDRKILTQVLNDYDRETNDFYRWKVKYRQDELSELVKSKSGIDFGTITSLKPVERGVSGRITRLEITGTKSKMIIGKELEIRKTLSKSHLYSSCFFVEKFKEDGLTWFCLHGAGWGHGVGLCQIGAAVMGDRGYTYREILRHYFPGSALKKRY